MVTRDDIVGYLRQPSLCKLKCLHVKNLHEDELFHKNKGMFPKINLIDEVEVTPQRFVHKGYRLSMEDSAFIVNNPCYWDMYAKIDLSLLSFGVTISDELVQYILTKETEVLNNLILNGEYAVALQAFLTKGWTLQTMFFIRDVLDTGVELQRCLISRTELQQLMKYTGYSKAKVKGKKALASINKGAVNPSITLGDINHLMSVREHLSYLHSDISKHILLELDEIIHTLQEGYQRYLKQTDSLLK